MGDGYTISCNGPATIAKKTELSKSHGGIMIWELGQDASGDDSLLKVIADNL
jgi:GH18 family chitinase